MLNQAMINEWFASPPHETLAQANIKTAAKHLVILMMGNAPPSIDLNAAVLKVREAVAIAVGSKL